MKLSEEPDVETMRGNEISTVDKVHRYLSIYRVFDRTEREHEKQLKYRHPKRSKTERRRTPNA